MKGFEFMKARIIVKILTIVQGLLVLLKLTNVLKVSWLWIFLPAAAVYGSLVILFTVCMVMCLLSKKIEK